MNKQIATLLVLSVSLSTITRAATYGGGSGTEGDPYQIWTAEQLNTIGANPADWGMYFKLMDDIDMSAYTGTQYNRIGTTRYNAFTGTFDGNNHVVRNLTYTTTAVVNSVGLFGGISYGTILDLGVENILLSSGGNYVGGLAGWNDYGTITGCYVTGSVSGKEDVGGLVGMNYGTLILCFATGSVSGTASYTGGLVGQNDHGTLTGCYTASLVTGTGYSCIGGLVGYSVYGSITSSYATGPVTGTQGVGGLVGGNSDGSITGCYAAGSVTGTGGGVGGLAGGHSNGSLNACFATGSVTGTQYVGGLTGSNSSGTISGCYASGLVSGTDKVGGLAGSNLYGLITICNATGPVSGKEMVGGLVGDNQDSTITFSYAAGSVQATSYSNQAVGGLVGSTRISDITSCYATGSVVGTGNNNYFFGGLAGASISGSLTACYSTGSVLVTGQYNYGVGGLVGSKSITTLTNCYAAGLVRATGATNNYVGGLVGDNSGTVTACFWDIEATKQKKCTGEGSCDGMTGKSTAEMMTMTTFTSAGWDFTETDGDAADWMMLREGEDYPRLAWQPIYAGDIVGLYGVDLADYAELARNWMHQDCPANCEQADIDNNGTVDLADLSIIAVDWLR